MSEREEYTPTMDEIRGWYAGAVDEYRCDTGMSVDEGEAAFDRAIAAHDAAHDQALRERIAREIEGQAWTRVQIVEALRGGRDLEFCSGRDIGICVAARIARGEGSE